jgi:lysophospholipase L1-like esterase
VSVRWISEPGDVGAVAPSELVALIGDSLAVGLTAPLGQELAPNFTAASKGGTDIKAWLSGFMSGNLKQVLAQKPAVVLISLGTNDTAPASQPNPVTIRERVLELVKRVRDAGAQPVWLFPGTLPWSYDSVRSAVKESGARAIEQPAEVKKPGDGIHPDGASYKLWAQAIAKSLRSPPSAGVSRGGGLLGGILIVAAAVGLLWATLNVSSRLSENPTFDRGRAGRAKLEKRGNKLRWVDGHGKTVGPAFSNESAALEYAGARGWVPIAEYKMWSASDVREVVARMVRSGRGALGGTSNKVYISDVISVLPGLTKEQLLEMHRAGQVELSRLDLVAAAYDAGEKSKVLASDTRYLNSEYQLVRS